MQKLIQWDFCSASCAQDVPLTFCQLFSYCDLFLTMRMEFILNTTVGFGHTYTSHDLLKAWIQQHKAFHSLKHLFLQISHPVKYRSKILRYCLEAAFGTLPTIESKCRFKNLPALD